MLKIFGGVLVLTLLSTNSYAQQSYEDIDKENVSGLIADYLANNAKVKDYGVKILIQADETNLGSDSNGESISEVIILDSKKLKARLGVWRGTQIVDDSVSSLTWTGLLMKDKRIHVIAGRRSVELDVAKKSAEEIEEDYLKRHRYIRTVPTMLPICDLYSFKGNGGPLSDHWRIILDEENLLAAQANERYIRAEFKGKQIDSRSRFQIYFDKEKNNLPAISKFFITTKPDKPFSTDFELSFFETTTEWGGDSEKGFRPMRIQMHQVSRVVETRKLLGMVDYDLKLNWKFSGFRENGELDTNWFDLGLINSEYDALSKEFEAQEE